MNLASDTLFDFFLVIPPGFEKLASEEIPEDITHEVTKGGIELKLGLARGFHLNNSLRIPTRILIRIISFKARDLPKLFNKVSKIPWRLWLHSSTPKLHISCSESRLFHTGRIEDTLTKAIQKSLKAEPIALKFQRPQELPTQVYIRIYNDEVTISIDTSHPELYKRGSGKFGHAASLRENLAYGCWKALLKHTNESHPTLVDPMCGSGTFLTEALEFKFLRPYAYESFPISSKTVFKISKVNKSTLQVKAIGYDIDREIIKLNQILFPQITWDKKDIFVDHQVIDPVEMLIVNPPYNKRLKTNKNMKQMINQLLKLYRPTLLGAIIPKDQISQISPDKYSLIDRLDFRNGGLACRFIILKKD